MPTYIKEVPSKEYLESRFYEKHGFILWKPCKISRNRDSERAHRRVTTYEDASGYYRIAIGRKSYPLSRIVYQIHYGDLTPEFEVDHIDLDKKNNRIENLRKVPQEVNKRNRPKPKNGSRETGVCLNVKYYKGEPTKYWVARWYDAESVLRGKHFRIDVLGYDLAFQLACEHREKMIAQLNEQGAGYSPTHGK